MAILLIVLGGFWSTAEAATTGQVYPTLGTTVAETPWLDDTWVGPTNIYADDGVTASVTTSNYDTGDQTYVLKATGFDFSSIPNNATITGVTVRVNTYYTAGGGDMDLCQLLNTSRAKVGTNLCAGANVKVLTSGTGNVFTIGGSSELWGNALTPAWLKDADFGVALGIWATGANSDVFVDYVSIEVTYTEPLSFSGVLYQEDGVTPVTATTSIKLAISTTTTPTIYSTVSNSVTGAWQIAPSGATASAGTPVVVWVDGDPEIKASIGTRAEGSTAHTGLNLRTGKTIFRHEDAGPLTLNDLSKYDYTKNSDIPFHASSSMEGLGGWLEVHHNNDLIIDAGTTFEGADFYSNFTGGLTNNGTITEISNEAYFSGTQAVLDGTGRLDFGDLYLSTTDQLIDTSSWTGFSAASASDWQSVTFGEGIFVAVSYDGDVMTSYDGAVWTSRSEPESNEWRSVTYGNGMFVAVASSGTNRVMTSPDGITWTARTASQANDWFDVTYGEGLFVAVSWDGTNRVMTSPDGITWTARTAAQANEWTGVIYGEGQFVAVAESGTNRVMTSPDGITWTARTASALSNWHDVAYGNGIYVAVSTDGDVMTSSDGITWTAQTPSQINPWYAVTYGDGIFVAVSYLGTNRIMTSPDGETWTAQSASEATDWNDVVFAEDRFVAVAGSGTNRVMVANEGTNLDGTVDFTANATTTNLTISTNMSVTAPDEFTLLGDYTNAGIFSSEEDDTFVIDVSAGTIVNGYDLTVASYDSVSLGVTETNAYGMDFSRDGTNLYVIGYTSDNIRWYTLSTPWDISTASYQGLYYIGGLDDFPNAVYVSNDGTKIYFTGDNNNAVAELSLSTPYDITTASYVDAFFFTEETSPVGLTFNADGTILYIAGESSDSIHSYTLSPAWDVSTAVYIESFSMAAQDTSTGGVHFSADGTQLFRLGWQDVFEYSLATPFDISTASYVQEYFLTGQAGEVTQVKFSDDGLKMYILNDTDDLIYQYTTGTEEEGTPGDTSKTLEGNMTGESAFGDFTIVAEESTVTFNDNASTSAFTIGATVTVTAPSILQVAGNYTNNGVFEAQGGELIIEAQASAGGTSLETVVIDAFDISTAVYDGAYNAGGQEGTVTGFAISSDGTRMYVVGYVGDDVNQYALSTPYDVTTASVSGTPFSFSGIDDFAEAIDFSADGTKMFILGSANDRVFSFTLSSAWDVTTASYDSASFYVGGQDGAAFGLAFKSDGTKMYMLGADNDRVYAYTLSSAWDVTTASYDSVSYLVSGQETSVEGLAFNDDGTRMYVTGATGDDVNQYALSTPWDISTASVEGSPLSVAVHETYPASIAFNTTGSWMYILGSGSQEVNAYTIGTQTEQEVSSGNGTTTISGNLTGTSALGNLTLTFPETFLNDGVTWDAQDAVSTDEWSAVTYGEGLYVAVSWDGTIMTSEDGIDWTSRTGVSINAWYAVVYGNGIFVASGDDQIMTSPDGITWTEQTPSEAGIWWNTVTYGEGLFVAVGVANWGTEVVMTSPDGEIWTTRTAAEYTDWYSVAYGNGVFVAVAYSGTNQVMTSPDGITWTARSAAQANGWQSVTFGEGLFVAVADTGTNRVMTSPDGITWTARSAAEANSWKAVTYGGGIFTAVANDGTNRVMTSPDGITWTAQVTPGANSWLAVGHGDGRFVAVAHLGTNQVMTSTSGYVATGTIAFANNASTTDLVIATEYTEVSMPGILTISDDYTNNGSVVGMSDAHIYLNGETTQGLSGNMTGTNALGTIDFSGAGIKLFADNASASAITIASDTTVVAPQELTITGDFTNEGTFDSNNGTLYIEGSGSASTTIESSWDVTTASVSGSTFSFASQETVPTGIHISPDGTAMHIVGWTGDDINQYSLSTPYDITTASVDGTPFSVASQAGSPDEVVFNPDGTIMYVLDQGADEVNQYSLGTPYDVTTASYDTVFGVSGQDTAVSGLAFKADGTKMFIAGYTNDRIYQYSLSSAWDVGTASYDSVFLSIGAVENEAEGLQFKPDGTKMYVLGNASVSPYTLGTAWDLSTAVFDGTAPAVVTGSYGFVFGKDGEYMYVTSDATDTVTRYALDASEVVSYVSPTYSGNMTGSSALNDVVINTPQTFTADGTPWTAQDESENSTWSSITYGNGLFVALAYSGTNRVMTSPDGVTWTSRSAAQANSWNSITYGNGRFVAVSGNGTNQVMTSEDGITWTARSASAQNEWYGVTYGEGLFVAVAHNNYAGSATCSTNCVMTSPDGITWTSRTAAAANKWEKITYGEGLFVAIASTGTDKVMTSPDGITWTSRNVPGNAWYGLAYGNGTFVAVAYDWVITSEDGITWTTRTNYEANSWQDVIYGGGLFVAVSPDGANPVMISDDNGVNWTPRTAPNANKWWAITFADNTFVSVAQQTSGGATCTTDCVMTSTGGDISGGLVFDVADVEVNGFTVEENAHIAQMPHSLTVAGNYTNNGTTLYPANATTTFNGSAQLVSGSLTDDSSFENIVISGEKEVRDDPVVWTSASASEANDWYSVTYGEGLFVSVSQTGTNKVMTSPDGETWTARSHAGDLNLYSVTYGNGLFVAVGGGTLGYSVVTSEDGITWTTRTSPRANPWASVTYGNGLFVAVGGSGYDGQIMTSSDGIDWEVQPVPEANDWQDVTYGGGLFVAVSNNGTNRVMTSEDGITWTVRIAASVSSWYAVTYGEGRFVAVGQSVVMTSEDGFRWISRTQPGGGGNWQDVTYGNGRFVAVSRSAGSEEIMISGDGITWTAHDASEDNEWYGVTYGNGLFVAVSTNGTNRVMQTSGGSDALMFVDAVVANGVLIATTSSTTIEFPASATSTFSAIDLAGSTEGDIILRSNSEGVQWGFDVETQVSVAYIDVRDSNACSGNPNIVAVDSIDSGNNTCWDITPPAGEGGSGFSSAVDQVFSLGQPTTSIATLTIDTEVVTALDDIRIHIDPAKSTMLWNTDDTTAIFGGSASSKVSNPVSYENGGSVLVIPVSADFVAEDTLTVSGLSFSQFSAISGATSSLSLVVGGALEQAGTSWTAHQAATAHQWSAVTYGEGTFVAVSWDGTVMSSADGITWTSRTGISGSPSWQDVTYGNGLFVAVSSAGTNRVMTSPDGITWTARSATATHAWKTITYGEGTFVAIACGISATSCNTTGGGSRVMTSPDGITWTARTASAANSWQSVTYGDGQFVAVAYDGTNKVMTSPDGTTWTSQTSPSSDWNAVTFGEGIFVAVGTNSVMTSTNGTSWTSRTSAQANTWYSVAYGEGTFVAVSEAGTNRVMTSPDGITWTVRTAGEANWWYDVVYGEGKFVATALTGTNRVMTSATLSNYDVAPDDKTVTITGALVYAEHDAGQVDSVFSFQNQDDTALYRFKMTPNGENVSVSELAIEVSGARKITTSDLTDLRLYRDHDADGEISAGDVQIGGAGVFTITGQAGAITFSNAWSATTSLNYIVTADVSDISVNEYLTLTLVPLGITNTGDTLGVPILPYGELSGVQHLRVGSKGGGGAVGGEAPEGDGDVGGGGQDGGDGTGDDDGEIGEGANIGNEAGFEAPSATGAQHNEWTNGANAYASDNQNASATTFGQRQSYSGFGFSIPTENQIVGVAVKIEGQGGGGEIQIQLSWNGGANYTSVKSTNPSLNGFETVYLVGGGADTWGRTWSPQEFANGNFVLRISYADGPDSTTYVDAIQVRVYHQTGGGGGGGGGEI